MNKQQLSERIATIKQEMEVMKTNYSKLEGHLNESEHWLQTLMAFEQSQLAEMAENFRIAKENYSQDSAETEQDSAETEIEGLEQLDHDKEL